MKKSLSSRVKTYDMESSRNKIQPKPAEEVSPAFEIPGMADFAKSLSKDAPSAPAVAAPKAQAPPPVEAPKAVIPKFAAPKADPPKPPAPKAEAPKLEVPKFEAPALPTPPKPEAPRPAPPAPRAAPAPAPSVNDTEDIWKKMGYSDVPTKKADIKKVRPPGTRALFFNHCCLRRIGARNTPAATGSTWMIYVTSNMSRAIPCMCGFILPSGHFLGIAIGQECEALRGSWILGHMQLYIDDGDPPICDFLHLRYLESTGSCIARQLREV